MSEEQKDSESEHEADETARSSESDEGDESDGSDESSEASGDETSSASDDSASDDSASDEGDDSDEDAAPAAAAAAKAAKPAAVKGGTAGARLAAAKAAKAAKKAARKAREAEAAAVPSGMTGGASKPAEEVLAESAVGRAASKATEWTQANRPIAMGIAAVAAVALLGWGGWTWYSRSQAEAAGALLAEAIEVANAEIEPETETPPPESEDADAEEERTFPTRQARAEAALEAYGRVVSQHDGTEASRWARLGQAWAHVELGQTEEARESYEQALRQAGGNPIVAWRALEGIGFTYEAAQQWDEAIEKYEELAQIEDGAYSAAADYHIARMRIAKGETVEATTALRALIERIQSDSEGEEPEFPYVLAQAEIRLRELDPTAAGGSEAPMMIGPGGGGEGGGLPAGLEGLPPEILEQLRRQLQEGGGAGGGGEGE